MDFEIIGRVDNIEVIARGMGVKIRGYLRKAYGRGRWRKLKGTATVPLPNSSHRRVGLNRFEARGIGRRDMKIKRYCDES